MQTVDEPTASDASRPPPVHDHERLARARRRVEAMKGFYIHLSIFVLVLAGLFIVNAVSGGSWWVLWVFFGWGIGVVAHALAVFGRAPRAVAEWEERKVKQVAAEQQHGPRA
jgi:hypothetical protein